MTAWMLLFLFSQDHQEVYRKIRPSVVAIRSLAALGERSGTGVILSEDGLILTSYAVVPEGARKIRVWTAGPRLYRDARIVGASKRDELTLLRIKPRGKLAPIALGRSSEARIGDLSYTVGNAANSIILDNQPSFNVGIVSARYPLRQMRASSTYEGIVMETTAAVNVGMEGAPLLDARGRMIGFITLNYSPHRFLGCAIPIDDQRFVIARLQKIGSDSNGDDAEGALGMTLAVKGGKVVVASVAPGGAADRAGIQAGDVLEAIGKTRIARPRDLLDRVKGMRAGEIVWITIEGLGEVKLTLRKKK